MYIICIERCDNINQWNNTFYLNSSDNEIHYYQVAGFACGYFQKNTYGITTNAIVSIDGAHYNLTVTYDGTPSRFELIKANHITGNFDRTIPLNNNSFTISGYFNDSVEKTILNFEYISPYCTIVSDDKNIIELKKKIVALEEENQKLTTGKESLATNK